MSRRGRRDSSPQDFNEISRFLPVDGLRKSPPAGNAHLGKNGSKLRVKIHKTTRVVRKINVVNWTAAAHEKFAEMYSNGEMGSDVGQDVVKKRKKKVEEEERYCQIELLEAQLAELNRLDGEESRLWDEDEEFNPFWYNGLEFHRDEDDKLITQEGEIWGYIKDGIVVEGDKDEVVCQNGESKRGNDEPKVQGESKRRDDDDKPKKKSRHQQNYTEEEKKIILEYMLVSHTKKNRTGVKRELPMIEKCRILSEMLGRRKPQNIQTQWERYIYPEHLKNMLKKKDEQIIKLSEKSRKDEYEKFDMRAEIAKLKAKLETVEKIFAK